MQLPDAIAAFTPREIEAALRQHLCGHQLIGLVTTLRRNRHQDAMLDLKTRMDALFSEAQKYAQNKDEPIDRIRFNKWMKTQRKIDLLLHEQQELYRNAP